METIAEEVERDGNKSTIRIQCTVDGVKCSPYLHTFDPALMAKVAPVMDELPTLVDRFKAVVAMLEAGKDTRTETEKSVDSRLVHNCRCEEMDEAKLTDTIKSVSSKALEKAITTAQRSARIEAATVAEVRGAVFAKCGVKCIDLDAADAPQEEGE